MSKATWRLVGALTLLATLIVATPTVTSAEEFDCTGTVGAETLDNVRVPDGETCVLEGTKVKGTIKVETDATLRAVGVRVIGNVQGENAAKVSVRDSKIGGSYQVVQSGKAKIVGTKVKGDILVDENDLPNKIIDNIVIQDVQAFQNAGGVEIRDNDIDGNLQCKQNSPKPTGGGNVVQGNKEDQCKRL